MAKDGPDDFKAAKRAKIKVPIEAEFERRAALPSSGSHYVRWEESVELGGGFNPLGWGALISFPNPLAVESQVIRDGSWLAVGF